MPKKYAYIFDVDGTLAKMLGRTPYEFDKVASDQEIEPVTNILRSINQAGIAYVIIFSGREDSCQLETEHWLQSHGLDYDYIRLRKTGDNRDDCIVKKEMYDKFKDEFDIQGVFDDRPKVCRMWRELGLTVFQVGDPYVEF